MPFDQRRGSKKDGRASYLFNGLFVILSGPDQQGRKEGGTRAELDQVICWATGYSQEELESQLEKQVDCRTFIEEAALNPDRELIKGVVCGVRVEKIEDPLMRELRYLDKLIDELARGKKMEKILRQP